MFMLSSNEPVKVADLQKCDRNGKQFSKKLWSFDEVRNILLEKNKRSRQWKICIHWILLNI